MYNGLKFKDAAGHEKGVSASNPLPVSLGATGGGAGVFGSVDDAPWDGVAAEATVIALLKKIALNTEPAP